ncbi:MAG: alpha/beta fold hydrolase [Candidatus Geothermincolia bacterium]
METVVEFAVGQHGRGLRGILHEPEQPVARKVVVVMVPYGLNTRSGPHRFYVSNARALCRRGYSVLRFDGYGCGDSEGDLSEHAGLHRDDVFWRMVWQGAFIEDVGAAVDFVQDKLRPDAIVLTGICGGAVRSAFTANLRPAVSSVILSSFPSTIDDVTVSAVDKMGEAAAKNNLAVYLRKLANPRSWLRILTMKSDFKTIRKSLSLVAGGRAAALAGWKNAAAPSTSLAPGRRINWELIDTIERLLRDGKNLLVMYGENDRYQDDYQAITERVLRERKALDPDRYEKSIIPRSNHEFAFQEWQDQYLEILRSWLEKKHPVALSARD